MSVSDLVGEIEGVRRRTRRASSGAAVPLALLGLLVCGSAPFYAAMFNGSNHRGGDGYSGFVVYPMKPPSFLDRLLRLHPSPYENSRALGLYWLLGVPVTFALVAGWYAWRARRTGVSIDGWRVAVAGGAVFAGLVVSLVFGGLVLRDAGNEGVHPANFLNPLLVVVIGVFAVAWVQRSIGVLTVAVVFAAAVATADALVYSLYNLEFPWDGFMGWGWATIILGGVLLLSAAVAAVARGVRRA